jgi:hypothetical protein
MLQVIPDMAANGRHVRLREVESRTQHVAVDLRCIHDKSNACA